MKVCFDARMIDHPGIGRYIQNILGAMLAYDSSVEYCLFGDQKKLSMFNRSEVIPCQIPIYSVKELLNRSFSLCVGDIFHSPHFNVPIARIPNLVVTIHDLIYVKFPEYLSTIKKVTAAPYLLHAMKSAVRIIAVSEHTRNDIIEFDSSLRDKITVIYEAVDPCFVQINNREILEEIRIRLGLPKQFILFVGSLRKHKNVDRLIDAYILLKTRGLAHQLVLVGKLSPQEKVLLKKIQDNQVMHLESVNVSDLVGIYNLASVVVLASLYEGFGFPVVEAMACKTPVVVSNAGSLPEIVQDAGLLCNPYEPADIADKVAQVLGDSNLKQELVQKGLQRVKDFSWQKAAQETLKVYKEIYTSKRNI